MKNNPPKIRLAIIDDSELVRVGLQTLLQDTPDIELCGSAANAAEGLVLCHQHKPHVVLLDIRLPDDTGINLCRKLIDHVADLKVLFLTSHSGPEMVNDAIRAGAHGYLLKEINTPALLKSIRDVAEGKPILDPQITSCVMGLVKSDRTRPLISSLSPQEQRVLALIAEGRTNKEVASEMHLAEKTVKNYLSTIFEKLHVTRRSQAAVYYSQHLERQH